MGKAIRTYMDVRRQCAYTVVHEGVKQIICERKTRQPHRKISTLMLDLEISLYSQARLSTVLELQIALSAPLCTAAHGS